MDKEQIKALLKPFLGSSELNAAQMQQVSAHLELLLKWNAKINLTAVRRAEEIMTRHFGESFFAGRTLLRDPGQEVPGTAIDLGSGAGFPGLPMAIFAPGLQVTLIESQVKKATFLKEAIRAMELKNAVVFAGRGEDYSGRADLVTLRAVERFAEAARTASSLLTSGGRLGLMVGVGQKKDVPPGFEWEVGKSVPESAGRILMVGRKIQESK